MENLLWLYFFASCCCISCGYAQLSHSPEMNEDYITLQKDHNKETEIDLTVKYHLKEYNEFYIYGLYSDSFGHRTLFYQYSLRDSSTTEPTDFQGGSISLTISVPNDLMYYNHQNVSFPTNYFVSEVQVKAKLVLLDLSDGQIVVSVDADLMNISIPSPWEREHLPLYCLSWGSIINGMVQSKKIPTCNTLSNATIFTSILPVSGNTHGGYLRKVQDPQWPAHIPDHFKNKIDSSSKFTVTFWLFLTKRCYEGNCMVLQQRNNTHFHGILILINQEGRLHLQLHDQQGNGEAYTSQQALLLHTWMFVMVQVNTQNADLYIDSAKYSFHHSYDTHYNHFYGGNNSLWVVGGYFGTKGFSGYLRQLKAHPHTIVDHKRYYSQEVKGEQEMITEDLYKKCTVIQNIVRSILGIVNNQDTCSWYSFNPVRLDYKSCVNRKRSNFTTEWKSLRETVKEFKKEMNKDFLSLSEFAIPLHDITIKYLTKESSQKVVQSLQVSGCLGNARSYYTLAVLYKYGVGVDISIPKALKYQLMASQLDDPLAHTALAYRHQLGVDGLEKDIGLQTGYTRQAAVLTKQVLDAEKHEIDTHSELIRLDQASAMDEGRGRTSELFKWLSQQAKMGSLEAKNQMADMLFHGKQGVDANPVQAVEHFQDAANAGDPVAMVNLAVMHIKGVNVEKNITMAKKWLEKSVQKNSSFAYNVLGFIELHFHDNLTAALEYWRKGVATGDLQSTYNYANVMEQKNITESLHYYELAASKGERHSCLRLADLMMEGVLTKRNEQLAHSYYKYISEQDESIGWFMRDAIQTYLKGNYYASFINHLFAFESGLQLAGYNIALLLKEMRGGQKKFGIKASKAYYYINVTAELGWSTSLKEMGDRSWLVENDTVKASEYYSRSVQKNNHPEALYSLGYLIEHRLEIDITIMFDSLTSPRQIKGNLTLAAKLYKSCMQSNTEEGEGFYPCQLALFKVQFKSFIEDTIMLFIKKCYFGLMCILFLSVVAVPTVLYKIRSTADL